VCSTTQAAAKTEQRSVTHTPPALLSNIKFVPQGAKAVVSHRGMAFYRLKHSLTQGEQMAVKSSGLSTQQRVPPSPTTPSEEEMYRMPLEQLRELANKQLNEHNN